MGIFQVRNHILFPMDGISPFLFACCFCALQFCYSNAETGQITKAIPQGKTAPKKGEINYEYNK